MAMEWPDPTLHLIASQRLAFSRVGFVGRRVHSQRSFPAGGVVRHPDEARGQ